MKALKFTTSVRYVDGVISRLSSAPYHCLSIYLFIKATSIEHILGSRNYSSKIILGHCGILTLLVDAEPMSVLVLE